jgi:hypothetical protein
MADVREYLGNHRRGLSLIADRVLDADVVDGDALASLLGEALNSGGPE